MKCRGRFVFKSLEKRPGGEFTNDKGNVVKYKDSYILKVDEETEDGIFERKFKFSPDNKDLAENLSLLSPYSRVWIGFDIQLFGAQVKLVPFELADEPGC
jgi:hypothetical protein